MQEVIPEIGSVAGDVFVLQQDSEPAHHARDTVELLRRETLKFIAGLRTKPEVEIFNF